MPELDDQDPPEFRDHVNRRVTIDMLDTGELVQELVDRNILIVMKARRNVPREAYIKDGFYPAIRAVLACDLAKELQVQSLVAEEIVQNSDDLEFSAIIVVLRPLEDENPI